MSSTSEKVYLDEVIIQEGAREFNREAKTITVADGAELVIGEVLEVDSGDPDYKKLAVDANAEAVCLENYKNNTGASVTRTIPCLVRGGGGLILNYDNLTADGFTTKATAIAALVTAFGGDDTCITRTELS
jgi:hypothetical protein